MSDDTRTEQVVRDWLADADHPRSTEWVVAAVLDALPSSSQDSGPRSGIAVRRLANAGIAAAAVIAIALVGGLLLRPGQAIGPATTPSPTASPSPSPSPSRAAANPRPRVFPSGVTAIDMGGETWALSANDQSVWVQVGDIGIARIDRVTNRDTGVRVPEVPQMQFEGSDLWALDEGTGIIRLNPLTGAVLETIPGISGFYIVVDGTTAWVGDVGHSVDRVDLTTGEVVATIDVPKGPKEMAVFDGSVWVACDEAGIVARIDIATNEVVAEIPGGARPGNLAVGEGSVWVWNHQMQLLRIDPATNEVVATIDGISETLGAGVAVGGGSVWAAVPTGIGRIDPATNEIVEVIPITGGGFVDFLWFDDELWVSSTRQNLVFRIDPDA